MKIIAVLAVAPMLAVPSIAQAQDAPKRVQALGALVQCRSISRSEERLACFDRAAAEIDEAERRGDLFVTDRAEIQKTKRSLFGLNLPSFSLFKGKGGANEPEIQEIESTIAGSSYSNYKWVFVLADGSRWRQTESQSIIDPRNGAKVLIRRGVMNSYFLRINNAPGLRVERVN